MVILLPCRPTRRCDCWDSLGSIERDFLQMRCHVGYVMPIGVTVTMTDCETLRLLRLLGAFKKTSCGCGATSENNASKCYFHPDGLRGSATAGTLGGLWNETSCRCVAISERSCQLVLLPHRITRRCDWGLLGVFARNFLRIRCNFEKVMPVGVISTLSAYEASRLLRLLGVLERDFWRMRIDFGEVMSLVAICTLTDYEVLRM